MSIWIKNKQIIIYQNFDDGTLNTDYLVKKAFQSLDFQINTTLSRDDCIKNSSIVFLHGGKTVNEYILQNKPLVDKWRNKTLFVVFSSYGYLGEEPKNLLGINGNEYLIVYIQMPPSDSNFKQVDWKNIIRWTIKTSELLKDRTVSVEDFFLTYQQDKWIDEVIPCKNISDELLEILLLLCQTYIDLSKLKKLKVEIKTSQWWIKLLTSNKTQQINLEDKLIERVNNITQRIRLPNTINLIKNLCNNNNISDDNIELINKTYQEITFFLSEKY